jgi:hypothetical protein
VQSVKLTTKKPAEAVKPAPVAARTFDRAFTMQKLKEHRIALQTAFLVVISALAYAYRAHPYIMHPQLFAEDGNVWLAQGYNKPVSALLHPVNGFLHVPERLFGFLIAHCVPLKWVPFLFAVAAWALFMLVAYYILSVRTKIFQSTYERIFMVVCLCLIANFREFFFNYSNSAFLIGIVGVLIMTAQKPRYKIVDVLEKIFFFYSCFCLTFPWFYLPIALIERFKYKQKNNFFLISSAIGSVVQLLFFMSTHVNRSVVTLHSLWSKFTLLEVYNQIIVPAIRFARLDTLVHDVELHKYPVYTMWLVLISLLLAGYVGIRKGPRQVWYLLFFLVAMTLASLKSPTISTKLPIDAIKSMAVVDGANRYFVYGIIATNVLLIKGSIAVLRPRARYAFLVAFTILGVITSLHNYAFYIDKGFTDYTAQYNQQIDLFNSGKVNHVHILENPVTWSLDLYHNK